MAFVTLARPRSTSCEAQQSCWGTGFLKYVCHLLHWFAQYYMELPYSSLDMLVPDHWENI